MREFSLYTLHNYFCYFSVLLFGCVFVYSNEVYCVLASVVLTCFLTLLYLAGIPDHHDMDSFASGAGNRFSMQDDDEDDDEAAAMAMANRQSVIKFNVREDEEDDLEREVSRQN